MDADAEKARRKAEKKAAKAAKRAAEETEEVTAGAAEATAAVVGVKRSRPTEEVAEDEPAAEVVESEEERAKRKAEKKARKEAKRARKAAEADDDGAAAGAGALPSKASGAGATWPCYRPAPEVEAMSSKAVAAFHTEKNIAVEDPLVAAAESAALAWKPVTEFAHARHSVGADVMACTASFKTPSPIQAQAWPILLSGRDMIGIAATGSGKTLAFMLPALVHIQAKRAAGRVGAAGAAAAAGAGRGKRVCYPTVLVLAPTRELAMQTAKVSTEAGAAVGVRTVCIFGGMPKHTQREELLAEGGAHVVVATPGRLLDHMADGVLDLSAVSVLVLDEADRMLDMGFEKDIRQVVAVVPPASTARRGVASLDGSCRQTLMFSATWPPAIQAIAAEFLAHPVKVVVGSVELAASASITQIVEVLEPAAKDATLLRLLGKYHASRKNRVLVFCLYKKEADRVERFLSGRGWSCGAIHGDMSQEARIRAFNAFKEARVPLLIATDVAARGLDIPAVEYVINYTFPLTIEDYVHRIGRTGRGGATGTAHTLFTSLDKAHAGELANVLKEAGVAIPEALTKFGLHVKRKEHALYGAHFKGGADGSAPPAPTRMTFD